MHCTPREFIPVQEWLRVQETAPEAEAHAEQAEKGHAADRLQVQEPQSEKGHAADQPLGEKATQGSGISTQQLWSTLGPPLGPQSDEPAIKKAARSYVGQALVWDRDIDTPVESEESEELEESDEGIGGTAS